MNFLFICESWKIKCHSFYKNMKQHDIFNIDNNQKCFLSSKSAYYYDFWRSCDTEDWSNDAENTALFSIYIYSPSDFYLIWNKNTFFFFYLFYTLLVNFLKCFWKKSPDHKGCIYLIKNTVKTVKYYYNLKLKYLLNCNWFLWCSAEFSASLLQTSVCFILICWFAAQLWFFL